MSRSLARVEYRVERISVVLLSCLDVFFTSSVSNHLTTFAPCRLRGCKNIPAPFPGQMLYKATNCIVVY